MATDLESYYQKELPERETLLAAIELGIQQVSALLENVEFDDETAWPYWVGEGEPVVKRPRLSQSTASMIAAAIEGAAEGPRRRFAHGYAWHRGSSAVSLGAGRLKGRADKARVLLRSAFQEGGGRTNSKTYGIDDILTLSWHLDLFAADNDSKDVVEQLISKVDRRCVEIINAQGVADPTKALNDKDSPSDRLPGTTLYALLRFVRVLSALPEPSTEEVKIARARLSKKAHERFQVGLREHLSFADTLDSRFDPCELAFSLEGMLHTRQELVDDATANRVFDVIRTFQDRSPGWRPQTPLTIAHWGEVLYVIGNETATSVLCSFSILDQRSPRRRSPAIGHRHFALLERYWEWLKSRRHRLVLQVGGEVTGWRSERLGGEYLHVWENSQILEFLLIFRDYVRRQIAGEMLELSELDVILPSQRPAPAWAETVRQFEPTLASRFVGVYQSIGTNFILPRLGKNGEAMWSMLLYGPPGTGKTTIAEKVAEALALPLIKVSVSDFLTVGDAHMERRAKLIFEVLKRQMIAVVLFDELDQFLLARGSELFREQQSAFQLLTPGMLTKLTDLRASTRVIFILATNYDDRIDNAIKRPGRVDVQYLVLPPDLERRKKIISHALEESGATATSAEVDHAARRAACLGYKAIVHIAKLGLEPHKMSEAFDKEPRDIQFGEFAARSRTAIEKEGSLKELAGLIGLALECIDPTESDPPRFVLRMKRLVGKLADLGIALEMDGAIDERDLKSLLAVPSDQRHRRSDSRPPSGGDV